VIFLLLFLSPLRFYRFFTVIFLQPYPFTKLRATTGGRSDVPDANIQP